jgi:S-adenosylmethionine hydrolase
LLVGAAEWAGGGAIAEAVVLDPLPPSREWGDTFDGRDLFAPAVARLCQGADLGTLGQPVEAHALVRLFAGVVEQGRDHDGRRSLRCEVTWVDRFGNVQLAATGADGRAAGLPQRGVVEVSAFGSDNAVALPGALVPEGTTVRCVDAFADLAHGELGLLLDANGHLAVVAGEASAAHWLNVTAGELLVLSW